MKSFPNLLALALFVVAVAYGSSAVAHTLGGILGAALHIRP